MNSSLAAWFSTVGGDDLYLSVLVVAEIRSGIEKVRRRDPAAAAGLEGWLGALVASHGERILPVALRVAV